MAIEIKQLFSPVAVPAAVGVLYTMPTLPTTTTLKNFRARFSNTTGGAITLILYADVAATASSAANVAYPTTSIAANGYVDVDIPTLKAGDTLRGNGSAVGITMQELGGVLYS
jgi:hypothetical protein